MRYGLILLILLLNLNYAYAKSGCIPGVPCLPENRDKKLDVNLETKAAVFMLGLYHKGVAGGGTGICIDYIPPKIPTENPQFQLGLSTDSFVTGSCDLNDTKINKEKISNVLEELARQHGSGLDISIKGYADGQHYGNSYAKTSNSQKAVEESVQKNKSLAECRSDTIESLLKQRLGTALNKTTSQGEASPKLEKLFPSYSANTNAGVKCDPRRKVVIEAKFSPNVKKQMINGVYYPKHDPFSREDRSTLIIEFEQAYLQSLIYLKKTMPWNEIKSSKRAELVFQHMLEKGSLLKECEKNPLLKGVTTAFIDSKIKNKTMVSTSLSQFLTAEDQKLLDPGDLANAGGIPTSVMWCFKLKDSYFLAKRNTGSSIISRNSITGEYLLSQLQASGNSDISIGFDSKYTAETRSPKGDKTGYVCSTCGNGMCFRGDLTNSKTFVELDDRLFKSNVDVSGKLNENVNQKVFGSMNEIANQDRMSVAAMSKPRTYVVRNCKDCKCNVAERIRSDDDVSLLDPVTSFETAPLIQKYKKSDIANSCIFSNPVFHSCLVSPAGEDKSMSTQPDGFLEFYNPMTETIEQAADLNEMVRKITEVECTTCKDDPPKLEPITFQERINDVACRSSSTKRLPTQDELKDCAQEIETYRKTVK